MANHTYRDLTGQSFGISTVLHLADGRSKTGERLWVCHCECGKEFTCRGSSLTSGNTKSCGCLNQNRLVVGTIYGRLTVQERLPSRQCYGKWYVFYRCLCTCGRTCEIAGSRLTAGEAKTCGKCKRTLDLPHKLPLGEASFRLLYRAYVRSAARRGKAFELTPDEAKALFQGPCAYCGTPPASVIGEDDSNGKYTYNGIDRVDNTLGYTPANCVSCCWECNKAKSNTTETAWRTWLARVAQFQCTASSLPGSLCPRGTI